MKVASLVTELRVYGVKTFVRVTLNYRLIPAPKNVLFYILCVFLVTCSYMFRCDRHIQGAFTNVV